jgi:hypothetical protein
MERVVWPKQDGWYAPTGEEVVSNLEGDSFDPNVLNLPSAEGLPPLDTAGGEPGVAILESGGKKKAKKEKNAKEPKLKSARPAVAADSRPFLTRLANANPYNVLLGIGLGALVVAILCMFLQWASYGFAITPTI